MRLFVVPRSIRITFAIRPTPRLSVPYLAPAGLSDSRVLLTFALADDHHRRADYAVAKAVALLCNVEHLTFRAGLPGHRFVYRWVEVLAFRGDFGHSHRFHHVPELPLDSHDALHPVQPRELRVDRRNRSLQVVVHREQVDDQRSGGEAAGFRSLLFHAPLVINE